MIETPLQMARRHVVEQEARIAQQQERIARLAQQGHSTERSAKLLVSMKELLVTFQADLDRLSKKYASGSPPSHRH